MRIVASFDTSAVEAWAKKLGDDQMPYATAVALTRTARDVQDALTKALPEHLDNPTPFTQRAFGVQRATKRSLIAVVFVKPAQEAYLKWQIFGGSRPPARKAQKLPSEIKLNAYGNIPRGEIRRLVEAAKAGKRLSKARGRKLGISSGVDLFYGDPKNGMPPGVYKRVVNGDRHVLVPIVVFPSRNVRYEKRFPMMEIGKRVADRVFMGHFNEAAQRAIDTAR